MRYYKFICIEFLKFCLYICSFVNVVLNFDDEIEIGRWYRDNISLFIIFRCV